MKSKRLALKEIENMSLEDVNTNLRYHEKDNGSIGVTIWYISKKIHTMRDHMKSHKNDKVTYRKFLELIARRRKIIKHLK